MGLDIDIVWASVSTVLVVFATMAVGAVCSIFPRSPDPTEDISLLPRAFLAQISDLVNRITLPCLIWYSMGKSFSVDLLKEAWPLIILAWMLIGISQAIAYISRYMLNPPSYFRNEYTAMITMGNAVNLPLVMIEVLSSKEPLSTSSDEAEDVFEKGTSLIFMYSVGWNLYFWTVGIALWYTDEEETEAEMEDGEGHVHRNSSCLSSPRARKIKDSLVKLVKNPVNIALVLGLITGLVEPIKDTIIDKDGALSIIGSCLNVLGSPSVGITTIVMGGVLGKSIKNLFFAGCANEDGEGEDSDGAMDRLREEEGEREGSETAAVAVAIHSGDAGGRNGNLDLDLNLIMEADARAKAKANANPSDDVAIELGDIKASAVCKRKIQDSIVDTGRHLDDHKTQYSENTNYKYTTSTTISMQKGSENRLAEPASMASGFGSGAARAGSRSRAASGASDVLVVPFETKASVSLPLRITIGLVAVKMVLLPLVLMPFVYLVSDLLLDSNNENYSLTQLIAFLQCSLPSANLVLVVAQQMRRYQSTERMSQLYVIQYLVCMVTITASTTIALALAY